MLRIENLHKRYRTGDQALREVSFTVPAGQLVGLIGPSGAGKSTLIRCVNRLVEPTGGRIFLDDLELTALGRSELRKARRRIGMIFQEFALVERLTVMENVLSGRLGYVSFWQSFARRYPPADIAKAFALLERVGVLDQADKRADALSGGQRQRVGVARALEQDPELLLIDEPTASLDPKTSRQIMRLIREICAERNLPVIINIHDVLLAQDFVDRIVGLRNGELVFDGPPSALSPEVLTRIYGEEDWAALQRGQEREDASGAGDRKIADDEFERRTSLA
jgi:phosphonate transport system ATP-binding protein